MGRRLGSVAITALLLGASSCTNGSAVERTVRVDYQHDEFASFYWRYFPRTIGAHPGDTVVFRQEWTGEPHTVTFGTLVDRALDATDALEEEFAKYEDVPEEAVPEDVIADLERRYDESTKIVPTFTAYPGGTASQNAALPCYLSRGSPPADEDEACKRSQRRQPAFNGKQTYYSSGFIPPEGPSGNTYRVELADDIEPGTYRYMCTIHFPEMQGALEVRAPGAELPSQTEVNATAREEIEKLAEPLRKAYTAARQGRAETAGSRLPLPLGGYHAAEEYTVALLEFVPRVITARVNEPVTWTMTGAHTVSFDVPRYLPIYFVDDDGTVRRNRVVDRAAGGSPRPPPVDFVSEPMRIDGGTWDGSGFFSSGLLGSDPFATYTLRVSKPGRYKYACLIHPKMVGTLVVRS